MRRPFADNAFRAGTGKSIEELDAKPAELTALTSAQYQVLGRRARDGYDEHRLTG